MEAQFWHDKWESGEIGFHQAEVNRLLETYWANLNMEGSEQVLVPLCGKSLDMLWLVGQGHQVLGVELSQKALQDFLQENGLDSAEKIRDDGFCGYRLPQMTLLGGDFFDLDSIQCSQVGAVYDRAALVALPETMRKRYVKHLQKILPSATKYLLMTMAYDQNLLPGPPFCVTDTEVKQLFSEFADIKKLGSVAFQRKGVAVTENVYAMTIR